jgi:hypothetical protein
MPRRVDFIVHKTQPRTVFRSRTSGSCIISCGYTISSRAEALSSYSIPNHMVSSRFQLHANQGTECEREVSELLLSKWRWWKVRPTFVGPLAPSWIECLTCQFPPILQTKHVGILCFHCPFHVVSNWPLCRIRSDHRCRHRLGSSLRWVVEGHASLTDVAARIQPVQ